MKKIFIIIAFVFAWTTRAFAQIEVNNEDVKGPVKQVMIILESASPGAQISTYGGPVLNTFSWRRISGWLFLQICQ